jgi:hypothetical protein
MRPPRSRRAWSRSREAASRAAGLLPLNGEEFAGGVGHDVADGLVDPLPAAEDADALRVRRRVPSVDPHEGLERLGQPLPASPLLRDAVLGCPQEPMQREGGSHGLQPVQVLERGPQQARVDQARHVGRALGAHMSFPQGLRVQPQARLTQLVRLVTVRLGGHVCLSPGIQFSCSRIPDWAMR